MKSQDVLLLCLLINNKEHRKLGQLDLAGILKVSPSTINASLKRLRRVNLVLPDVAGVKYFPHRLNSIEFLTSSVPYMFCANDEILKIAKDTLMNWKANKENYAWKDI